MPLIGVALELLRTVKTVPLESFLFPTACRANCAPLAIVTPLAMTSSAVRFLDA